MHSRSSHRGFIYGALMLAALLAVSADQNAPPRAPVDARERAARAAVPPPTDPSPKAQHAFGAPGPGVMVMRWIPSGRYSMGHPVNKRSVITRAFWIGETEVIGAQWKAVRTWALENGYTKISEGRTPQPNFAVTDVEWFDCAAWCNARSEMENLTPCYYFDAECRQIYRGGRLNVSDPPPLTWLDSADGYRLPTSAEWEKAARGGLREKHYPWGLTKESLTETEIAQWAAAGNLGDQLPVASHAPNGFGLYDMAGGVWEWCWDFGAHEDELKEGGIRDAKGPATGERRIIRGGSWNSRATECTVYNRVHGTPSSGAADLGFRVVRGNSPTPSRR